MTTTLSFGRDAQGYNAFAPPVSTNMLSATIAAAGNATVTCPTPTGINTKWVVAFSFTPGADIWVSYNANAAAPAGSTFAATTSELNPGVRLIPVMNGSSPTTINIYNNGSGNADVWVSFYAV
jgi:hypothetical protein